MAVVVERAWRHRVDGPRFSAVGSLDGRAIRALATCGSHLDLRLLPWNAPAFRGDRIGDQTSSHDDAVLTGSEHAEPPRSPHRREFWRLNAIARRPVAASLQRHAFDHADEAAGLLAASTPPTIASATELRREVLFIA